MFRSIDLARMPLVLLAFFLRLPTYSCAVTKRGRPTLIGILLAAASSVTPHSCYADHFASNQFGLNQQTDLFTIDQSGTLNVRWVVGADTWSGPVPISRPGVFPPGAAVTASNQFGLGHQTDVFAIDTNGALNVSWVVDAGQWNGPAAISRPGVFPPGAAVTASNQFGLDHQTDVFAVDNNGTPNVSWVVDAGQWNGPVALILPPEVCAVCNDGSCQCGNDTQEHLCRSHGGVAPNLGCIRQP